MTNTEAIQTIDTMWKMLASAYDDIADSYAVAYTMAVEALKAQELKNSNQEVKNQNDLISRQSLMDALHYWFADGFDEDRWWNSTHVLAAVEMVPSVQPERQEGKADDT